MFTIDPNITDLKVRERNVFKVLFSMNNHQVATPEGNVEEARSYVFFFRDGSKVQTYIGLYFFNTDRRMFYTNSSNPYPESHIADIEDEARAFAEDLGALLDEIDFFKLSTDEKNQWIEEQEFLSGKKQQLEPAETATSSPPAKPPEQPAVDTAPVQPAAPVPPSAVQQQPEPLQQPVFPQPVQQMAVPPVQQPAPVQYTIPPLQQAAAVQYTVPPVQYQPVQVQPNAIPSQQTPLFDPTQQPVPVEVPVQNEVQPAPPVVQPPLAAAPSPGAAPVRVPAAKPSQQSGRQQKPATRPIDRIRVEEEAVEQVDTRQHPDDLLELAVKEGVVKAPKAQLKKDLRSPAQLVSRDKEALARLLASF